MKKYSHLRELFSIVVLATFLLAVGVNYYIALGITLFMLINFEWDRHHNLHELGITQKRTWEAIKVQMPFTIVAVIVLAAYAFFVSWGVRIPGIVEYLGYWIISVPLQELLVRGYMQSVLREHFSRFYTVFIASSIFALAHYFSDTEAVYILMGGTFIAGMAWGWVYEKERNLLGPIVSHTILGTILFLIIPSNAI